MCLPSLTCMLAPDDAACEPGVSGDSACNAPFPPPRSRAPCPLPPTVRDPAQALYPEFTVSETLAFCASLHGVVSKELDRKKTFLYGLLELEGLSERLIKNLSGGQKRRVSFACALVHNPQLLVLDEPTVGVDPLCVETRTLASTLP